MNLKWFLLPVVLVLSFGSLASPNSSTVEFNAKGWNKHKTAITTAAHKTQTSAVELATIASIETTMGANMTNKSNRNVGGLFQFTNKTWRAMLKKHGAKYGLSVNTPKSNARANALMAAELVRENRDYLETKLGREVTLSEIYMAHMLGTYGAERMLKAKDNRPARSVTAPCGNKSFFYAKGKARTVGQFKKYMESYVERHAATYRLSAIAYMSTQYDNNHRLAMR